MAIYTMHLQCVLDADLLYMHAKFCTMTEMTAT